MPGLKGSYGDGTTTIAVFLFEAEHAQVVQKGCYGCLHNSMKWRGKDAKRKRNLFSIEQGPHKAPNQLQVSDLLAKLHGASRLAAV